MARRKGRGTATDDTGRRRESSNGHSRPPLTPAKKAVFLTLTTALPFILVAALELALRAGTYGGDLRPFESSPVLGDAYLIPARHLGKRYFPRERFPPSPPSDPFLAAKPARSMRIFVLGESSAAGFPYPSNGTFSRVLRDALSDVLTADKVEVVNMGMAATNSFAIADIADEVAEQKPDAVIIYGGHNEYYGALGAGSTETLGRYPAFVRVYLKLQSFRTFLLLRNIAGRVASAVQDGRSTAEIEADPTRMQSVVADQGITLGGATYSSGTRQYESNLRDAIRRFRQRGIPVFVGSTPSNLRDLSPFGASAVPPDTRATRVFDSARTLLAAGDSLRAAESFARARDLDVVRFRAPGEFQAIVERVARETGSTYVPVAEGFAAASAFQIPGGDLFLEHVHANQRGYVLLARMYFDALHRQKFLGRRADLTRFAGWDAYTARMSLTDLDHRIAYHTVKTVTTRWPFVGVTRQLDYRGTYRPVDFIDSLAFTASRGGMPWAQAKLVAGERYVAAGETERALAELQGLMRDAPGIETGWRLAGRALFLAGQTQRARPYLIRAQTIHPTGFSAFGLGVIAMQEKNPPGAIVLFQQALLLSPDMPAALYHLSLAYGVERDLDRARALALRLAQVSPGYPGLSEWMSTIGLPAR